MCRLGNDASKSIYDPEDHADGSFVHVSSHTESKTPEGSTNRRSRKIPRVIAPLVNRASKSTAVFTAVAGAALLVSLAVLFSPEDDAAVVRVAMLGNSMMYFNDMPRVLEAMARGRLEQSSCLHGNADFSSHLWYGNGMYDKWTSGQGRIYGNDDDTTLYDFGACSVQQLLFGTDSRMVSQNDDETQSSSYISKNVYGQGSNSTFVPEDAWEYELVDDGTNPCLMDGNYLKYKQAQYEINGPPQWDFVLINDNTRSPCCTEQRAGSMELLEDVYLPWLQQIGATPIFMATYGYWATKRDMSGLIDIPTFASLTYNGYQEYARLAEEFLPESQKPRIALVGNAFLMIYDESPSLWADLMHTDEIHLSPSGTFLQSCVVYATIFGKLPPLSTFMGEEGPDRLWRWARRMSPFDEEYKPYPTVHLAQYLFHIAHRVAILGETPKSLIDYPMNTSVYFTPDDSLYSSTAKQDGSS
jgi:hypothetical protein